jgi:hypothetical protein
MAFRVPADPGDPGVPEVRLGRAAGADGALERRIVRDGAQVLAHGALVCPGCGIPLAAHRAVPISAELRCGFCDHTGSARSFVVADVYDTLTNEVYVVARVT